MKDKIKLDQCMTCYNKPQYEVLTESGMHYWFCSDCLDEYSLDRMTEIVAVKSIKERASYHFTENKSQNLWKEISRFLEAFIYDIYGGGQIVIVLMNLSDKHSAPLQERNIWLKAS